jgi:outer membrane lipoprotein carrier protein
VLSAIRRASASAFAAAAYIWLASAAHAAAPTAPELAQSLQRTYEGIKDFSADFVHTYQGGALRKQLTERGHVLVLKPGRMRWEYTAPEQKLFVSDGSKMYSYLPEDKQVIVSSVPQGDDSSVPTLFLAGKGNLARDFTPSLIDVPAGLPKDSVALKLVPKTPQHEYDWIVVAVDPATLRLRGLLTVDGQGGSSAISFMNLKENVGLTDKQFTFSIPRGVDVLRSDDSRR